MSLSQQTRILQEVERDVPFCTFTDLLKAHGITAPDAMGGSCLVQSAVLARRLCQEIRDCTAVLLGEFRTDLTGHIAALAQDSDGTWLHDPSYLPQEPLGIHELSAKKPVVRVGTFPTLSNAREASASQCRGGVLFCIESESKKNPWHFFDTEHPISVPQESFPIAPPSMSGRLRDYLELHVLIDPMVKIDVKMSTKTGVMTAGLVGFNHFRSDEHTEAFNDEVRRICKHLHMARLDLMNMFHEAWKIHKNLHEAKL